MDDKQMIKALQIELSLMQDALFLSLGAKQNHLEEIAQFYIESLSDDEVDAKDILNLAKQIKANHPKMFENE